MTESLLEDVKKKRQAAQAAQAGPSYGEALLQRVRSDKDIAVPVLDAGEPGLRDMSTRFWMGRGTGFNEKLNEFKKSFPEGDLIFKSFEVGAKPELAFRESARDKWAKVDPGMGEKFEPVGDLVDFLGEDLFEIAGDLTLGFATRGRSLLPRLTGIAAGNIAGSAGGELLQEYARGTQEETAGEWLPRIGTKAAVATGFGAGLEGAARAVRGFRGRGFLDQKPGADQTIRAAQRTDLPIPPTHMLTDQPWLTRIGMQAQALLPEMQRKIAGARSGGRQLLTRTSREGRVSQNLADELGLAEATYRNRLLNEAENKFGIAEFDLAKLGDDIQPSIDEYEKLSREHVSRLYNAARSIEEPVFNLAPLRNKARELLEREKGARRIVAKEEPSPLVLPEGMDAPIRVTESEVGGRQARDMLEDPVRRVLNEIAETQRLETRIVDGKEITPTDQLYLWREILGDSAWTGPETARRVNINANQGKYAIDQVLNNPTNSSKEFIGAYNTAKKAASNRFNTLDMVSSARGTNEPIEFIRTAYGKQSYERLRALKNAVGGIGGTGTSKKWQELRNGYVRFLLEPGQLKNLDQTLSEMRPEFKGLIFNRGEEKVLKDLSAALRKADKLNIKDTVGDQVTFHGMIEDLVGRENTAEIATLGTMIKQQGGVNSPIGKNIRAGILSNIIKRATVDDAGVKTLNSKILDNLIKQFENNEAYKFVPKKDWRTLKDVAQLEQVYKESGDAGTSLMAAQVSSQIGHLNPSAVRHVLKAKLWTRLLVDDRFRNFLVGEKVRNRKDARHLATLGSIISKVVDEDNKIDVDRRKLARRLQ